MASIARCKPSNQHEQPSSFGTLSTRSSQQYPLKAYLVGLDQILELIDRQTLDPHSAQVVQSTGNATTYIRQSP